MPSDSPYTQNLPPPTVPAGFCFLCPLPRYAHPVNRSGVTLVKYQNPNANQPNAMKRLTLFLALFLPVLSFAQILKPARWSHEYSVKESVVGQEITLRFSVKLDKDWYIYSSDFDPELGPQVTTFSFVPHPSYQLVGGIEPQKPKRKYDDLWGGEYTYFLGTGVFVQKIKVLATNLQVRASVSYQVCTDIDGRCIPLEDDFSFPALTVAPAPNAPAATSATPADAVKATPAPSDGTTTNSTPSQPGSDAAPRTGDSTGTRADEANAEVNPSASQQPEATGPGQNLAAEAPEQKESLLLFMFYAFIFGIAAIFTPCVFPMIPMTVSFFTKRSGRSGKIQAILYGFFIVLIYTLIGAVVTPLAGPGIANVISTHWLPNLIFFIIFIVFALSFFGMFDLVLPSSLVNKMDAKADRGGIAGVFFMAFTLVLVSFSCTGPIVGSLLVESAGGNLLKPIAGMFAFSMAFALPFGLFAFFPQWLNKLPKSGGWLNSVKVTLGFVELALAFKFLSMIDLVYHLGILDRDTNIAIWMAITLFMCLYYLGKIRLPHDTPVEHISVPRMLLALASFAFFIYLLPGMFGAPLKALSGVLPPQTLHDFDLKAIIRENQPLYASSGQPGNIRPIANVKHAERFRLPHGLQGYFELEQAMEAARAQGKPLFIDFTGHGCANCRKMEDNVWADPGVLAVLSQEYVIVALYVDDPTPLPESEWVTSTYDQKVKKTIGQVNMDIQISRFNNNAQPFYLLMNHDGTLLAPPRAYDLSVPGFIGFLNEGLGVFKQNQAMR